MGKKNSIDLASLAAWLLSDSVNENVAPRTITIQAVREPAEGDEEGETTGKVTGLVAIATVGEEDYLAGGPQDDIIAAIDSLDDELASEASAVLRAHDED